MMNQNQESLEEKVKKLNETADTTSEFDATDIQNNKAMAIIAYLGILVLVPIFGAKDSKFARFHANQGLLLCISAIVYFIAESIVNALLLSISWRLSFVAALLSLIGLVFVVLMVIGMINAGNGRAKELPVIGKFKILS